jgi:ornithine cyclodeaminase/alanine dehydrogenase-like protein (mu-crystallin family)
MPDAIAAVERAFLALHAGQVQPPVSVGVSVPDGTFHVKACASASPEFARLFVAKINSNFPGNRTCDGTPTIQGVVAVFETGNGRLRALVDSPSITGLRTAATTAVAIRHLAPEGARTATLVGCGALGRFHVEALAACGIERLSVHDKSKARAQMLAEWARGAFPIECDAVDDLYAATLTSKVIVTCTSSTVPFLAAGDVRPGTLVAAVGADNERKSEIASSLLERARIVTDLSAQCRKIGDLRNAMPNETFVCGELADVVAGRVPRTGPDEIVVFDSTGLALEDLAVCQLLLS